MMWSSMMETAGRCGQMQVHHLGTPSCGIIRFMNSSELGEQGFGIGPILRQGWSAAAGATDRLTDTLYDYVPEGVSRATVRAHSGAGSMYQ